MFVAVAALVVAAGLAAMLLSRRSALVEKMQFGLPVPGEVNHMALSPDGRMLAFSAVEETSGGADALRAADRFAGGNAGA